MHQQSCRRRCATTLEEAQERAGLYKEERVLAGAAGRVDHAAGRARSPEPLREQLSRAVRRTRRWSPRRARRSTAGATALSSVRFICGTQALHKELERRSRSSSAPRTRSSIRSCFDANGGLFETLLSEEDAVISDQLNHASIIDGIRLCKAQRFRYKNCRHGRPRSAAEGGRRRRGSG